MKLRDIADYSLI